MFNELNPLFINHFLLYTGNTIENVLFEIVPSRLMSKKYNNFLILNFLIVNLIFLTSAVNSMAEGILSFRIIITNIRYFRNNK